MTICKMKIIRIPNLLTQKLDLVCLIMDLQRKQREMSLINEENTQSIRQFKGMKLGSMPPSTAQQARYENTKANFLSLTRVQYV